MGYTTTFEGELLFPADVTLRCIALVKSLCNIENPSRDWQSWNYMALQINADLSGIEWSGGEKWYYPCEAVNYLIDAVRKVFPEFTLTGEMQAQGEDFADRWILRMVDGRATRVDCKIDGLSVVCPECGKHFVWNAEKGCLA